MHHHRTELPIFPLTSPVVPGMLLPLRLFEPRYAQLGLHLSADTGNDKFATVMIERGSEVGGGEQRSNFGCLLDVVHSRQLEDASWELLAAAVERVRVVAWLDDSPWPRGLVEPWPDDDDGESPSAADLDDLVADLAKLVVAGRPLGFSSRFPLLRSLQPSSICWYVAAAMSIGDIDRQQVLAAPTLLQRYQLLRLMMDDQSELMELLGQHGEEPNG